MKRFLSYTALLGLAALLAGCFDSSSSGNKDNPRPDPAVDFSQFVKNEIEDTDDTAEPVDINNQEFSFNDQNNEQAFDELFIQ